METPNCDRWSELPMDLLRCVLEHLNFVDFHRAKMVCSNWYLCSKQTLGPKAGSPMLIMSQEGKVIVVWMKGCGTGFKQDRFCWK
ncbi:unnamed protein product [Eruca vesicaria subsp. sativa]|uniref:F-box domain-containing protein n=1 Tax=Eruca vesicaria subsp. sativa TaxID=29727 RepID=A0ABC8K4J9_ERUVS|nr:unnamed protein product [Eruca vesicaria subsp. sativa]